MRDSFLYYPLCRPPPVERERDLKLLENFDGYIYLRQLRLALFLSRFTLIPGVPPGSSRAIRKLKMILAERNKLLWNKYTKHFLGGIKQVLNLPNFCPFYDVIYIINTGTSLPRSFKQDKCRPFRARFLHSARRARVLGKWPVNSFAATDSLEKWAISREAISRPKAKDEREGASRSAENGLRKIINRHYHRNDGEKLISPIIRLIWAQPRYTSSSFFPSMRNRITYSPDVTGR